MADAMCAPALLALRRLAGVVTLALRTSSLVHGGVSPRGRQLLSGPQCVQLGLPWVYLWLTCTKQLTQMATMLVSQLPSSSSRRRSRRSGSRLRAASPPQQHAARLREAGPRRVDPLTVCYQIPPGSQPRKLAGLPHATAGGLALTATS